MRGARILAAVVTAMAAGVIAIAPAVRQQSNVNPYLGGAKKPGPGKRQESQKSYPGGTSRLKELWDAGDSDALLKLMFGEVSLDRAAALHAQAVTYFEQGRYREAEELFNRALVMAGLLLGTEHPDVLVIVNNLAKAYSAQSKYGKAEKTAATRTRNERKAIRRGPL